MHDTTTGNNGTSGKRRGPLIIYFLNNKKKMNNLADPYPVIYSSECINSHTFSYWSPMGTKPTTLAKCHVLPTETIGTVRCDNT